MLIYFFSAKDTFKLIDLWIYHISHFRAEMNEPPLVRIAANCVRRLIYQYRDDLMAGMIVAGWDKKLGGQANLFRRKTNMHC